MPVHFPKLNADFLNPFILKIMDQASDPAVTVIERKSCSFFNPAPAPEEPGNGIIILEMIVGPRYQNITFGTDKLFIPHKMITTGITYPREQKTQEVIT